MDEDIPIKRSAHGGRLGQKVLYFEEVTSTNQVAKDLALQHEKEGTVIIAKRQVAGRGRMGKAWSSDSEDGIWISILLRPPETAAKSELLTLLFSVCLVETIKKITNVDCNIKWPNDIIVKGRKVCGILCERLSGAGQDVVIVGIGINLNQTGFGEELSNKAVSLKMLTGEDFSKEEMVRELLAASDKMYDAFLRNDLRNLFLLYKKYSMINGREIFLTRDLKEIPCTAIEVNSDGNLVVMHKDGEIEEVLSGEVSVQGVYGYG